MTCEENKKCPSTDLNRQRKGIVFTRSSTGQTIYKLYLLSVQRNSHIFKSRFGICAEIVIWNIDNLHHLNAEKCSFSNCFFQSADGKLMNKKVLILSGSPRKGSNSELPPKAGLI